MDAKSVEEFQEELNFMSHPDFGMPSFIVPMQMNEE